MARKPSGLTKEAQTTETKARGNHVERMYEQPASCARWTAYTPVGWRITPGTKFAFNSSYTTCESPLMRSAITPAYPRVARSQPSKTWPCDDSQPSVDCGRSGGALLGVADVAHGL